MREGLLPVVTYSGPLLADLLVGSFVVENLFQTCIGVFSEQLDQPGLYHGGRAGDPVLVLLLTLNLLVDVVYGMLDKRVNVWPTQPHPAIRRLAGASMARRSSWASRRTAATGSGFATTARRWWPPFF